MRTLSSIGYYLSALVSTLFTTYFLYTLGSNAVAIIALVLIGLCFEFMKLTLINGVVTVKNERLVAFSLLLLLFSSISFLSNLGSISSTLNNHVNSSSSAKFSNSVNEFRISSIQKQISQNNDMIKKYMESYMYRSRVQPLQDQNKKLTEQLGQLTSQHKSTKLNSASSSIKEMSDLLGVSSSASILIVSIVLSILIELSCLLFRIFMIIFVDGESQISRVVQQYNPIKEIKQEVESEAKPEVTPDIEIKESKRQIGIENSKSKNKKKSLLFLRPGQNVSYTDVQKALRINKKDVKGVLEKLIKEGRVEKRGRLYFAK